MCSDAEIRHYEGLVVRTAALAVTAGAPYEFDDVAQLLRLKVLYAIERYDAAKQKPTKTRDDYVFMCITDRVKDLHRKRRRRETYLDDLRLEAEDKWDLENGLAVDPDVAFAEVEDEPVELPSTLSASERVVIELLVSGYRQAEAARSLGWRPSQMERTMRSIRLKLADWRPSSSEIQPAQLPLLLAA